MVIVYEYTMFRRNTNTCATDNSKTVVKEASAGATTYGDMHTAVTVSFVRISAKITKSA